MTTFKDIQDTLYDDLMASTNSATFPLTRIKSLINQANQWATSLFPWTELQRAMTTNAEIGQEYYDYPDAFRTDTLGEFLHYNGNSYERVAFKDYIEFKRRYPNSTKQIFADYARQYFIFPTPTTTDTILVWGGIQADTLTADADVTIFSNHDDSGNEAIERKALSLALRRIDSNLSASEEKEAVALLTVIWGKVEQRQQTKKRLDKPMFRVPDFFAVSGSTFQEGNFDFGEENY